MEVCYQCKKESQGFGVVALIPIKDISAEDLKTAVAQGPGADGKGYAAMPICPTCHRGPTIQAHFFFRDQMQVGLKSAGSMTVGSKRS